MSIKSFFQRLFGNQKQVGSNAEPVRFMNGYPYEYSVWTGELYANSLVRSIIHKIASYGSMITFEHVRGEGSSFQKVDDDINRLLTVKPNSWMTPADLQYKVWTDLLLRNNCYIWLKRDKMGKVIALIPIVSNSVELVESGGFLFYRFTFDNGDRVAISPEDIIHNRRYFYKNDYFGSGNEPLRDAVGLVDTMTVSLDASLKNGAQIKGILKHSNTIDPEDLAKHEKLFKESYLKASNSGGIGMLDSKFDFIPINYQGKITDAEQMKEIRDYVYRYFGMNDKILMSDYTSEQWQSYHEAVIAPILNNMEQNYNIKLFTEKELGYKNKVVSSVNLITFMSNQQKIAMVKLALDGALYNRNEIRSWFGDAPIEGGDTYQFSKNFTENATNNPKKEEGDAGETGKTDTSTTV